VIFQEGKVRLASDAMKLRDKRALMVPFVPSNCHDYLGPVLGSVIRSHESFEFQVVWPRLYTVVMAATVTPATFGSRALIHAPQHVTSTKNKLPHNV
jgi:hypothetical protein